MSDYTQSHAIPSGIGMILGIGNGGSLATFTTIGETKSFAGPTMKTETADVTNTQSPDGVKEFKPTLTDPGEISTTVNYVPGDAGQQAVYNAMLAKSVLPFQMTLPQGSVETAGNNPGYWSFQGLVTEFNIDIPLDKEATVAIKVKVSGLPTYTPESA
jgi:hypothetical protein